MTSMKGSDRKAYSMDILGENNHILRSINLNIESGLKG